MVKIAHLVKLNSLKPQIKSSNGQIGLPPWNIAATDQLASIVERPSSNSSLPEGVAMISDATNFRREAARAIRLAKEPVDALTQERLQALAAGYIRQAIELESGGQTAPPDIDPTEPI